MKLPPYPRTKPSGVEWLGDVPEHWEVKRLKTSATCWVSNVDKVPAEDELPVRLCNYTDVYYHDHITPDMELMETTATADEIRRFGLRAGDVVITKDSEEWSDIAVPALVKKTAPDLVCGYHLAIIRSHPKALLGDYLLRAFQSCAVNQQFQVAASGVTRYGLPKASIGDAWIPLPTPTEQRSIAAFLDRETGRVDRLVAKKRELIERLKEKRTALISRTVTRGLFGVHALACASEPAKAGTPNAAARAAGLPAHPPLKPSGLDWLGDIPKHWEVLPIKHLLNAILDTEHKTCPFYDDGEFLVARTPNIRDGKLILEGAKYTDAEGYREWTARGKPKPGDILFTREAPAGEACIVPSKPPLCIGQRVVLFRTDPGRLDSKFAIYSLYGGAARIFTQMHSLGSTVTHFNMSEIAMIPMLVPPLPEQAAIAAYLDEETAKLDALVGKVEEAVERLQEYRTALITAAVTGKINVRAFKG
jgi:type I restriction enzyme S subunit